MTLPSDFIVRTQKLLGNDFLLLETALQEGVPTSIRINSAKKEERLPYEQVPWCTTGYYLPERLSFTFDPLFHAGGYYVQEASSMFLEQAVKEYVTAPVRCLDLCAAPGGKSTHLLSVLPENSLLVSNDVIRNRSRVLAENIIKWGNPGTVVTNNDPADFSGLVHFFDVLVADVPCSGEGMFRKDPDSIGEWSVSNVNLCAARQKRILRHVWDSLKPGGLLIYSTCTYNTEENEENIHYIIEELGATPLPVPTDEKWNIAGPMKYDYPVYRFFPHKVTGEGFFLAVLRKNEEERSPGKIKPTKEKTKSAFSIPAEIKQWLTNPDAYHIETKGEKIQACPLAHYEEIKSIGRQLTVLSEGIQLGEIKGKDILPSHPLAMSTALNRSVFPSVELTWENAITYLKKETIYLPAITPKGYILLTHNNIPLGFVKNIGNRSNNLYPSEWRIRTSYIPENVSVLP